MKTATVNLFVEVKDDISPDELDWRLMGAARELAISAEYFDPSMYAANLGKLIHGYACELPLGDFMVLDMSANQSAFGTIACGCGKRAGLKGEAAIIPNHTHIIVFREEEGFMVSFCEGKTVPKVLHGIPIPMGERDPHYMG